MNKNFWFADEVEEDYPGYSPDFAWRVFIQLPGMVDCLSTGFQSREAAEEFIQRDILGAGFKRDL